ncbi:alpha/beta hydrolase [Patescibacteria group bacterium]|nr:alpha/beta hydrolase [Patescibacteria group bacterium]
MKKVFLIHGLEGSPNGGWRPWLMTELDLRDVYAAALVMPTPDQPIEHEWVDEIARHITEGDEIYLVGHSLGVTAILRYLETASVKIAGVVLVSGPCNATGNTKIDNFFIIPFNYATIRQRVEKVAIIHSDNDHLVPLEDAKMLEKELSGTLTVIHEGGHLGSHDGWTELPQALEALEQMGV